MNNISINLSFSSDLNSIVNLLQYFKLDTSQFAVYQHYYEFKQELSLCVLSQVRKFLLNAYYFPQSFFSITDCFIDDTGNIEIYYRLNFDHKLKIRIETSIVLSDVKQPVSNTAVTITSKSFSLAHLPKVSDVLKVASTF
jgi:hypothetical protein